MDFNDYQDKVQQAVVAKDVPKLQALIADAVNAVVGVVFNATDKAGLTVGATAGSDLGARAAGRLDRYGVKPKTPPPIVSRPGGSVGA
jgi:hypothetical protein